jgi:plasmid maintenance system killer protein
VAALAVEIRFQSLDLRRTFERQVDAEKAWGSAVAVRARRRLDDLRASRHLREFLALPHIRHTESAGTICVHVHGTWALLLQQQPRQPRSEAAGADNLITVLGIEDRDAQSKSQ